MKALRELAIFVAIAYVALPALGETRIPLIGGDFKPRPGLGSFKAVPSAAGSTFDTHALLVLKPGDVWNEKSDAGANEQRVQILRHVHGNTYLVRVTGTKQQLQQLVDRFGASIATIPSKRKVSVAMREWKREPDSRDEREPDKIRVLVRLHDDVPPGKADDIFEASGIAGARPSRRCPCWEVAVTERELKRLTEQDAVSSVEPDDRRVRFTVSSARAAVGADTIQGYSYNSGTNAGSFSGTTGRDTIVGILDQGGLAESHPAFWKMSTSGVLGPSDDRIVYSESPAPESHTSHVAGIIGGSGGDTPMNLGGEWALRGVAPECEIVSVVVTGKEHQANQIAIIEHHADVTNNSYVYPLYDAVSFATDNDAIVRGDAYFDLDGDLVLETEVPERPSIWSAGNNGTSVEYGAAGDCGYWSILSPHKNGIVVGGSLVDSVHSPVTALARWEGSSIGPTLDGRLKPDLMAPACKVNSDPLSEYLRTVADLNSYNVADAYEAAVPCGTSYSSAFVTGLAALLLESWHGSYGTIPPHPSSVKAALIQGAIDMEGTSDGPRLPASKRLPIVATKGPDFATGWGAVSAEASLAVVRERRVLEDEFDVSGDSATYLMTVPNGAPSLRVTLAWDDRSASTTLDAFAPKLVNDLDLELYGPLEDGPSPHLPWVLPVLEATTQRSPTTIPQDLVQADRGVDSTNNVEQVVVEGPKGGTWEVRVRACTIANGDSQTYSVASDLPLVAAAPPAPTAPTAPTAPAGSETTSTEDVLRSGEVVWTSEGASVSAPAAAQSIVLPARRLCRMRGRCAPCARFGRCKPVQLALSDLAPEATVQIVGSDGTVLTSTSAGADGQATLVWPRDKDRRAFLKVIPPAAPAGPRPRRFGVMTSPVP
jgi:hypothetical protein